MRAVAKILRARASEHSSNFCEQFEQRPNFASTLKFSETIRYPLICFVSFFCLFACFVLGVLSQPPSGGLFDKNVRSNTNYRTNFTTLKFRLKMTKLRVTVKQVKCVHGGSNITLDKGLPLKNLGSVSLQ